MKLNEKIVNCQLLINNYFLKSKGSLGMCRWLKWKQKPNLFFRNFAKI